MEDFKKFLSVFEQVVILPGMVKGKLGRSELVPIRSGKLAKTHFGREMGEILLSKEVAVVDYYGHLKRSIGFIEKANQVRSDLPGRQLRMVESSIVHFASIKIEMVAKLSPDILLVAKFPEFKNYMLALRGFK
jgi:hypothetical protein